MLTANEFRVIATVLKSAYSDTRFMATEEVYNTWYQMLCDIDFESLKNAVKAYIQTEVFTPTIAGIRAKVKEIEPEEDNFNEAWGLVRKALSRSGYYWEEEYARLPEKVQKAVGHAENLREWSQMEADVVDGVIYSQFIKSYTATMKRSGFIDRLSEDIAQRLAIQAEQPKQRPQIVDKRKDAEITNFPPHIRSRLTELYRRLGHAE